MNIQSLRELIQYLKDEIDYCPPDNATDAQFERAIERANRAGKRLEDLGPIVALLDELDRLTKRVERLERRDRFHEDNDTLPPREEWEVCHD